MGTEIGIPRSAKDVIDDAIRENQTAAWIMNVIALACVSAGLFALVKGVLERDSISSFLGTIASSLFWPAMTAARRTRKENIAMRLLEAPLSRADTAKEASEMLHKLFNHILTDNRSDGK